MRGGYVDSSGFCREVHVNQQLASTSARQSVPERSFNWVPLHPSSSSQHPQKKKKEKHSQMHKHSHFHLGNHFSQSSSFWTCNSNWGFSLGYSAFWAVKCCFLLFFFIGWVVFWLLCCFFPLFRRSASNGPYLHVSLENRNHVECRASEGLFYPQEYQSIKQKVLILFAQTQPQENKKKR